MVRPPTPLVELVGQADLIVVARHVAVVETGPEPGPELRHWPGYSEGLPQPPGWEPTFPSQVVELAVDRVLLGGTSWREAPSLVMETSVRRGGFAGSQLLFLRAASGGRSAPWAELHYSVGITGCYTETDLVQLAHAHSTIRDRVRAIARRPEREVARKLAEVRRRALDIAGTSPP